MPPTIIRRRRPGLVEDDTAEDDDEELFRSGGFDDDEEDLAVAMPANAELEAVLVFKEDNSMAKQPLAGPDGNVFDGTVPVPGGAEPGPEAAVPVPEAAGPGPGPAGPGPGPAGPGTAGNGPDAAGPGPKMAGPGLNVKSAVGPGPAGSAPISARTGPNKQVPSKNIRNKRLQRKSGSVLPKEQTAMITSKAALTEKPPITAVPVENQTKSSNIEILTKAKQCDIGEEANQLGAQIPGEPPRHGQFRSSISRPHGRGNIRYARLGDKENPQMNRYRQRRRHQPSGVTYKPAGGGNAKINRQESAVLEEDPSFVPRAGNYFLHEDRLQEDDNDNAAVSDDDNTNPEFFMKKSRFRADYIATDYHSSAVLVGEDGAKIDSSSSSSSKWAHDAFDKLVGNNFEGPVLSHGTDTKRQGRSLYRGGDGGYPNMRFRGRRGGGRNHGSRSAKQYNMARNSWLRL